MIRSVRIATVLVLLALSWPVEAEPQPDLSFDFAAAQAARADNEEAHWRARTGRSLPSKSTGSEMEPGDVLKNLIRDMKMQLAPSGVLDVPEKKWWRRTPD